MILVKQLFNKKTENAFSELVAVKYNNPACTQNTNILWQFWCSEEEERYLKWGSWINSVVT